MHGCCGCCSSIRVETPRIAHMERYVLVLEDPVFMSLDLDWLECLTFMGLYLDWHRWVGKCLTLMCFYLNWQGWVRECSAFMSIHLNWDL
jgi:hypothetical protein